MDVSLLAALRRPFALAAGGVLCLAACGCGGDPAAEPAQDMAEMARLADAQSAAQQQRVEDDAAAVAAAERAEMARLAAEGPSAVTTDDMQRGKKIKGSGLMKTPIRAGIRAEQKLNLIQVEQALNLFWADKGYYPKSHEEFMKEVIEFNEIQLEPLEEPYEYWYDAETNQLMKRVKPDVAAAAKAEAEAE